MVVALSGLLNLLFDYIFIFTLQARCAGCSSAAPSRLLPCAGL
jgi:Na+-driven multidrug efflux pump